MNIKIVTENNILGRKTEKLVNEFFDIDKLNIIQDKELIIIISKNYGSDLIDNSNPIAKKKIIENGIPNNKAITILPEDLNYSKFIIIAKENVFDALEYLSTITHELTHVIDFINHFNELGNIYLGNATYDDFFFWTEFNAKKVGLKRFQSELDKRNERISLKDSSINFIMENNLTNSANIKVYNLVHFFARISIYDNKLNLDFNEAEFPREYLISQYGEKIFQLYHLLNITDNYEKFKINRKSIDQTLDGLTIYN